MADLSITAANVKLQGNANPPVVVQVGETITQGQPLYKKTTDAGKYWKADADTLAESLAEGIAMTPGTAAGYVLMARPGSSIDLGATLVVGTTYYVSSTAGGICLFTDLASGDFPTIIGQAATASKITLLMQASGIAKA